MLKEEIYLVSFVYVIIILFIIKIIDDVINIIINIMTKINNQETLIKELTAKLSILENNVNNNWIFMSEEINDIYPAIKAVNLEIMNIKNKNE